MAHRLRSVRADAILFACVVVAALAFLVPRVCRTVALVGDSPELVSAGVAWGVAHAPGYPLQVSILHLASGGQLEGAAWRSNLTSALLHALTVAAVSVTVRRATGSKIAGLTSAVVLLLARHFVFASLYAEVFPLNDLFTAVLLSLALERRLVPMFLVLGLAAAHHPTIVLLTPALAALVLPGLVSRARVRPASLAAHAALVAIPFLLSYALVLVLASRHPLVSWGEVHDLRSLARLVARIDYGGPLQASRDADSADLGARLGTFTVLLWDAAGGLLLALATAGAVVLARRAPRRALALVVAFAFSGPIFALLNGLFQLADEEGRAVAYRFLSMPLVPLAMLAGAAVLPLEDALRRLGVRDPRLADRLRPWAPWLALGLPVAIVAVRVPALSDVDMSRDRRGSAFVEDLLRDVPDGSVVLLSGDVPAQAGEYACVVERACGRRMLVLPGMLFLDWYRAQLAARWPELGLPPDVRSIRQSGRLVESQIDRRPVFALPHVVARDPEITAHYALEPSLLLVRVLRPGGDDLLHTGFLARAETLADGADCGGCSLGHGALARPSFEGQTELQYEAAIANHAAFALSLGEQSVAARLLARRNALAAGSR